MLSSIKVSRKDERCLVAEKDDENRKSSSAKAFAEDGESGREKGSDVRRSSSINPAINASFRNGGLLIAEKDEKHRKSFVRCKVEHCI